MPKSIWVCFAVIISFSGQGFGVSLFNNKACAFFGKYSLSLYVGHFFYAEHFAEIFPFITAYGYRCQFLFYLAVVAVTALGILLISNTIRKFGPTWMRAVKRVLVRTEE